MDEQQCRVHQPRSKADGPVAPPETPRAGVQLTHASGGTVDRSRPRHLWPWRLCISAQPCQTSANCGCLERYVVLAQNESSDCLLPIAIASVVHFNGRQADSSDDAWCRQETDAAQAEAGGTLSNCCQLHACCCCWKSWVRRWLWVGLVCKLMRFCIFWLYWRYINCIIFITMQGQLVISFYFSFTAYCLYVITCIYLSSTVVNKDEYIVFFPLRFYFSLAINWQ